ncbi:GCN5-related N-acetyltransferase [Solidesulfovibrio carbinoliphilus subsp. oakridgensis]|uniref:GCN5-related N-acetyltransferase n=1 Tax=Solidesulfovibrio carbinoliphilus subsp. oakridgensis TaxID=694327 RepID=G7Q3X0_9BACT|nr:GNAT family N-acetyltransferase [Solidesulfovibrio carbinoliphilus]EHJ46760.1 GCN5-related N-acetyltransferase [Solidesulfovibrio carbinoliphilus subsp. oakridgensis]
MQTTSPPSLSRQASNIAPATDMAVVRVLFQEYATGLGFDLCFQNFDQELADLPGCYALPAGGIWLAWHDGMPAGCVALRPLGDGRCEMKRLYVRPAYAGQGLGRALAEAAVAGARERGYRAVRLDTLASMTAANALYKKLGFRPIEPYRENPLAGALYYELAL